VRVAVDCTPLLGTRTGIGVIVDELVHGLRQRAADDIELVPYAVTWRGRHRVAASRWPMPARPLRALWLRADLPPLEWWTGDIAVAHGTNYVVPPSRRAAPVVSVHDLTAMRWPELCTEDTREYPRLVRRALDRGAMVHTDSQFVADEVVAWSGIDAARVVSVHPGIPRARRFAEGNGAGGNEGAPPVDGPYVLALGTVEPRKDLPTLVRAFGLLAAEQPELRLVVAGSDGWGVDAFRLAVAALAPAARGRVVRLGYVDDATRATLLSGATVFAYPSIYEGFGFPPLEAMAAGTPVVATTAGSLPEVLGAAAVLVPPRDPEAMAGGLRLVLDDDAGRVRRRDAGRAQAASYSWDAFTDRMVALYRTAAAAR
jgi:glycosyltransferase involved in cell wall biosynthesis